MKLKAPFEITSRLMAGITVGGATISIGQRPRDAEGRTQYQVWIDLPGGHEFHVDDLRSGCQGGGIQDCMASLLGFLSAAAESYRYRMSTGRTGENEDLFPPEVVEWAYQNSDEITMLALELEETPELVID
jgi:hypothetical protein